jgi:capsular polysaccharide export protein
MFTGGIKIFSGKRVLLLQGPLGPFFKRLSADLQNAGAQVHAVNFNGGDWLFSPKGAINFHDKFEAWPSFFRKLLKTLHIDTVMLFGDCRPIHCVARTIASEEGINVEVFEEGYLRPDFITLERDGVNGYSPIPRSSIFYLNTSPAPTQEVLPVGKTFSWAALYAVSYYAAATVLKPWFRHYQHHRPLTMLDGLPWIRGYWRKFYYLLKERGMWRHLTTKLEKKYFLVPLQVHNDSQLKSHSDFDSVTEFIERVAASFSENAESEAHLVFKHHPMDRGYNDYSALIAKLAHQHGIKDRLHYIHDQHLPSLLRRALGVVTINSTVGMSALHHGAPLKVCGRAIYDMKGLTFSGSLDDFWTGASSAPVDRELYKRFRDYVITHTQLNGSFYKPLAIPGSSSGIMWPVTMARTQSYSPKVILPAEQTAA